MKLLISEIQINKKVSPRRELDEKWIEELMPVLEKTPPILVTKHKNKYILLGGFHRIEAAKRLGWTEIEAIVEDVPPHRWKARAALDNDIHGKRLQEIEYIDVILAMQDGGDTRAEIAEFFNKSIAWVDQKLQIGRNLDKEVLSKVKDQTQARELSKIKDPEIQKEILEAEHEVIDRKEGKIVKKAVRDMSSAELAQIVSIKKKEEAVKELDEMLEDEDVKNRAVDIIYKKGVSAKKALKEAKKFVEQAKDFSLSKKEDYSDLVDEYLKNAPPLSSVISHNEWGPWGNEHYLGSCSGYLLIDLFNHFQPQSVLDPMCGSNTTGEVCRDMMISYQGFDLTEGYDVLTNNIDGIFDIVFVHPPYYQSIRYSTKDEDLSNCESYSDFISKMDKILTKLYDDNLQVGGKLIVLVGDVIIGNEYYWISKDIAELGIGKLKNVLINLQINKKYTKSTQLNISSIDVVHEVVLIIGKE